MKNLKTPTLIMLFIALIAIPIVTTKQAAASTPPNNPGNIIDDILFLRRETNNNLTTTQPTGTSTDFTKVSSATWQWINGTSSTNWVIDGGTYNFTFWMDKTTGTPKATVTFKFGYIKDSTVSIIAEAASSFSPRSQPAPYSITGSGRYAQIPDGSNLILIVQVSASDGTIGFHYDGEDAPTRIITPTISVQVPEFPSGLSLLAPTLLMGYFALKRFKRGL
ncbi:MAG: hypothetical protein QXO20_07555 [Candidatus Bathyarchaeia archaeon]